MTVVRKTAGALLTLCAIGGAWFPLGGAAAAPPSPEQVVSAGGNALRYHPLTPYLTAKFSAPGGGLPAGQVQTIRALRDIDRKTQISAPSVPYVVVEITAYGSRGVGEIAVHACDTAPDPASAIVITTDDPSEAVALEASQAIVPLVAGAFCLTSTVATDLQVRVHGYVTDDSKGAAWADTSDVVLGTALPVPLSGGQIPAGTQAVALMVEGLYADASTATISVAPCGGGVGRTLVEVSGEDYLAVTLPLVPVATGQCLVSSSGFSGRVTMLGIYKGAGESSPTMPPNMRLQRHAPPRFTGQNPQRVLDTRAGGPVATRGVVEIDLSARLPFSATSAVLNVTAVGARQDGYLTVYPCDVTRPDASNLNYTVGATVANAVTIGVRQSRKVCVYAEGSTDVLVDLSGWYDADGSGDGLVIQAPKRELDTRGGAMPAAGSTVRVDLSAAVPAGATSAVLNLTAVGAWGEGYVTAFPCDQPQPNSSSLNFSIGQTVPNFVTVKLAADRSVCLFTSASTHLLADLQGWYAPTSPVGFAELTPMRAFDSRRQPPGAIRNKGIMWLEFDTMPVAWLMNVTVVSPRAGGYLTVYPCETKPVTTPPNASNLNYVTGQVVPNQVLVAPGANREVCYFSYAETDMLADLAGSFTATPTYTPFLLAP